MTADVPDETEMLKSILQTKIVTASDYYGAIDKVRKFANTLVSDEAEAVALLLHVIATLVCDKTSQDKNPDINRSIHGTTLILINAIASKWEMEYKGQNQKVN